jgi:hypothetical protein
LVHKVAPLSVSKILVCSAASIQAPALKVLRFCMNIGDGRKILRKMRGTGCVRCSF